MNRRDVLKIIGSGIITSGLGNQFVFASETGRQRRLVVVFLYGGADPLTLFPPAEDDFYFKQRPKLAVSKSETLPLDTIFGLNASLGALAPILKDGEMAILHGFGSPIVERSHSFAQSKIERGVVSSSSPVVDGFLSRAIVERFGPSYESLRAVALQTEFPTILAGDSRAITFSAIDEFLVRTELNSNLSARLKLNEISSDSIARLNGKTAAEVVEKVRRAIDPRAPNPAPPDHIRDVDFNLAEVTRLIKADVGLRIAFTSSVYWDTHADQRDRMIPKMKKLSEGLARFRTDLKKSGHWDDTTILVMTEFGRCVQENGSQGTDHGLGSAAILLGGSLKRSVAGRVLHSWKPLKSENLSEGRELPVVRDVFGELLVSQLGLKAERLKSIFPDHEYKKIGLLA